MVADQTHSDPQRHRDKVSRCQHVQVYSQEFLPGGALLTFGSGIHAFFLQPLGEGASANFIPQVLVRARKASVTPGAVLAGHSVDQFTHFPSGDGRPGASLALPSCFRVTSRCCYLVPGRKLLRARLAGRLWAKVAGMFLQRWWWTWGFAGVFAADRATFASVFELGPSFRAGRVRNVGGPTPLDPELGPPEG